MITLILQQPCRPVVLKFRVHTSHLGTLVKKYRFGGFGHQRLKIIYMRTPLYEVLLQALQSSDRNSITQMRKLKLREFDPRSCDEQTVGRETDYLIHTRFTRQSASI